MFALLVRNEMRQGRGINYYRLTKSYIDKDGNTKHRSVLCLGELPGFDKDERNRLAAMLTTMIEDGQSVMCNNPKLYEEAMSQYVKYRSSKYAQENNPRLIAERKAREKMVYLNLSKSQTDILIIDYLDP